MARRTPLRMTRSPSVLLVDDVRDFRDRRPAAIARSSREAMTWLRRRGDSTIAVIWLDFDLQGGDTAQPIVDYLVDEAASGTPVAVAPIEVHSSNARAGRRIYDDLRSAGYNVHRNFAAKALDAPTPP